MSEFKFKPIGIIRTPYKTPEDCPRQSHHNEGVLASIELEPKYAEGLLDLEGFSHLILVWVFHQSEGFKLVVKPPNDDDLHGVFATRSPHRPNPIGLSVVRLVKIEKNIIYIEDPDMVDGTPVLDIKPYLLPPETLGVVKRGWLDKKKKD